MASQPTYKIDIDYFFRAEEARTPPQLRASNPLDDAQSAANAGRSQLAVASEEEVMGQMAGGIALQGGVLTHGKAGLVAVSSEGKQLLDEARRIATEQGETVASLGLSKVTQTMSKQEAHEWLLAFRAAPGDSA